MTETTLQDAKEGMTEDQSSDSVVAKDCSSDGVDLNTFHTIFTTPILEYMWVRISEWYGFMAAGTSDLFGCGYFSLCAYI